MTLRLYPEEARFLSAFPQVIYLSSGSVPWLVLAYDDTVDESAFWVFPVDSFGGTSFSVTVYWIADSANAGSVVWQARIGAITPNADSQDITTKPLGLYAFGQQAHLGTNARRLHKVTFTLSDFNALSDGDLVLVEVGRDADSSFAQDDLVGDAHLVMVEVKWS